MSQNVKFEQVVKIVNEFVYLGEKKGIAKLYTQDLALNGRTIHVNNKSLIHMGSCSYLGLELDNRLKEAAIDAVKKYGTYFSCSRIYVSCGNYYELEDLLSKLFNTHILLTTNSSLGHHSVMPIIIGSNDMVIFDQQAHISMQELSYKLSFYGTGIAVLRHNRLDELESKVEMYKSKYERIWYVIDGVYSMFGDLAPVKDIIGLLDKHKKLHLYVDDAHGMSWAGPNGGGYTMSQTSLHKKMIMGTSMAKGFGSCGGIFLFPNKEWRDKVRQWGGPLAYSGPQEPATVAAAIASAKIHLSEEIYELQNNLQKKIAYCNDLMRQYKIPLVSESLSPIFFVACGLPRVGFNLVERLIEAGFYTNLGIFPAVPETCTGVRFTLNNHLTFEDVENLVKAFAYHHPRALKDENRSMQDIYTAFRKFTNFEQRFGPAENFKPAEENQTIKLKSFSSIKEIDKDLWNNLLGQRGAFAYDNLELLEHVFSNNSEPENNWKFYYFIATDINNEVVLLTFFTSALSKDDMLAPEVISKKVEQLRKDKPYYLTSQTLMMGSMLTNGDHLYINRKHLEWKNALIKMLDEVWKVQHEENANSLFLRDFDATDEDLAAFFMYQGFVKIDTPENNILEGVKGMSFEKFYSNNLTSRQRKVLKKEALANLEAFNFFVKKLSENELKEVYSLYNNVKENNLALNTFKLPFKFFEYVNNASDWEIISIYYEEKLVAAVMANSFEECYSPVVACMDYELIEKQNLYKKVLYFTIKRGFELNAEKLFLGITANETKRKFGLQQHKQVAYIQVKDHYNQDLIDSMGFEKI